MGETQRKMLPPLLVVFTVSLGWGDGPAGGDDVNPEYLSSILG